MKIKQISRADIFSSQVLKPFLKLTNEELYNLIMQLVTYLLDKEVNFDKVTEMLKNNIIEIDEKIINDISSREYQYYEQKNYKDEIENMLYIYNNGLIICFTDLLNDNKNFIVKYVDEDSIECIKRFQQTKENIKIRTISKILEKHGRVIPDYFIEYANENLTTVQEKANYYIWAEQQGIQDENIITDLISEEIYENIPTIQVTLGGYADFTQTDPPVYEKEKTTLTECLLKVDSCGDYEFYIGDSGILSVLISKEDLEQCKFEKAVLDWDCC